MIRGQDEIIAMSVGLGNHLNGAMRRIHHERVCGEINEIDTTARERRKVCVGLYMDRYVISQVVVSCSEVEANH